MIAKVEKDNLIQKCDCGHIRSLAYSSLEIKGAFIHLTVCDGCNSRLEVLHLNNQEDDHGLMVSRVFAKVATQG
ncbi:MAG: hypothetical protein DRI46_13475 [Chloroflexi bacterium]|nr:MAG: hypothetical protein DRI46_13475 [Chloroflexota bacterium]